jgi:hypothetical protein
MPASTVNRGSGFLCKAFPPEKPPTQKKLTYFFCRLAKKICMPVLEITLCRFGVKPAVYVSQPFPAENALPHTSFCQGDGKQQSINERLEFFGRRGA